MGGSCSRGSKQGSADVVEPTPAYVKDEKQAHSNTTQPAPAPKLNECKKCTFINKPSASKCKMCGGKLQKKPLIVEVIVPRGKRSGDTIHVTSDHPPEHGYPSAVTCTVPPGVKAGQSFLVSVQPISAECEPHRQQRQVIVVHHPYDPYYDPYPYYGYRYRYSYGYPYYDPYFYGPLWW